MVNIFMKEPDKFLVNGQEVNTCKGKICRKCKIVLNFEEEKALISFVKKIESNIQIQSTCQ